MEKQKQKLKDFYNNVGEKYTIIYPNQDELSTRLSQSILKTLKLQKNAVIGDFGCGNGALIYAMAKLYKKSKFIGVDISDKNINLAHKKHYCKNIEYLCCDWESIGNKVVEKFDLIMCLGNTLVHYDLDKQKGLLFYFSSLLSKNGMLLVDTYIDWDKYFTNVESVNCKGYKTRDNSSVFSFIINSKGSNKITRNLVFIYFKEDNCGSKTIESNEIYTTEQYEFLVNQSTNPFEIGFSTIEKIKIDDLTNIFEYYLLKKEASFVSKKV